MTCHSSSQGHSAQEGTQTVLQADTQTLLFPLKTNLHPTHNSGVRPSQQTGHCPFVSAGLSSLWDSRYCTGRDPSKHLLAGSCTPLCRRGPEPEEKGAQKEPALGAWPRGLRVPEAAGLPRGAQPEHPAQDECLSASPPHRLLSAHCQPPPPLSFSGPARSAIPLERCLNICSANEAIGYVI